MADPFDDTELVQTAAQVMKVAADAFAPDAYPQKPTDPEKLSGHPGSRGMLLPVQIPQGGFQSEPWTGARVWERAAVPELLYEPFKAFNDLVTHLKSGGGVEDPAAIDAAAKVAGGILGGTAFKHMSQEGLQLFKPGRIAAEVVDQPGITEQVMQHLEHALPPDLPKIKKEVPSAKPTVDPPRVDDLGFYSHAEDMAKAWPQEKGTKEQALEYLKKSGTKFAELKDMGLDKSLKGGGNITREELVKAVQQGRTMPIEKVYGGIDERIMAEELPMAAEDLFINGKLSEDAYKEVLELSGFLQTGEMRMAELAEKEFTPEAWSVVKGFQEAVKQHAGIGKDGPPRFSEYSLDQGINPTYTESVIQLPGPKLYAHQHWEGLDNPILHIRTSQQKTSSGKKVLELEEMQSDWAQKGRDKGFRDEAVIAERQRIRDIHQEELITIQKRYDKKGDDYDFTKVDDILSFFVGTFGADRRKLYDALSHEAQNQYYALELNGPVQKLQGKRAIHLAMEKVKSGERLPKEDLLEAHANLNASHRQLRDAESAIPHHPSIETTDRWTAIGLRRLLRQAVEADVDAISLPSAKVIDSLGMGGKQSGHEGFYDKILPKNLNQILSRIDPSIKMHMDTLVGHEDKGQVMVFTLTPKAREKIAKGQRFYVGGVPIPASKEQENAPQSP